MFDFCKTLKDISELKYLDVIKSTDFTRIFSGCSSLTNIEPLKYLNVSKNLKQFFKY